MQVALRARLRRVAPLGNAPRCARGCVRLVVTEIAELRGKFELTTGWARGDRVATGIDGAAQEANQASPAPRSSAAADGSYFSLDDNQKMSKMPSERPVQALEGGEQ